MDLRAREAGPHLVRDVEVLVRAGTDGADRSGTAVHDVDVLVWGDAWEQVGSTVAAVDDAATLSLSIDGADQLERVLRDRLVVAVGGPASGAGPAARLQVETLEVTVRYREE